jgi:hypothetical protein
MRTCDTGNRRHFSNDPALVLPATVLLAALPLVASGADGRGREGAADEARPARRPETRPATVVEALRPLVPRLPKPTSFRLEEVNVGRDDLGLLFFGMPRAQRQKLDASIQGVEGFAGSDLEATGEASDLCVITFDDPAVAAKYPDWKGASVRENAGLIEAAAGLTLDKVAVERPKVPGTEAPAVLVRLAGKVNDTGRPYTLTHVRVAQGNRVVEVVLRNLPMPDKELLDLTADAARRVRAVAPPSIRPAPDAAGEARG